MKEIRDIKKYNKYIKNVDDQKIYLIRVWIRKLNIYVYKAGTTKNLKRRLIQLNSYFDSCGKIILIFVAIINSDNVEKSFHSILQKYRCKKHKNKEIYNINSIFYDKFLELLTSIQQTDYFESQYYIIDDLNYEIYDNLNNQNDQNQLDQNQEELIFWNKLRNY